MEGEKIYITEHGTGGKMEIEEGTVVSNRYGSVLVRVERGGVPVYKWFDALDIHVSKEKAEHYVCEWNSEQEEMEHDYIRTSLVMLCMTFILLLFFVTTQINVK